jgi:hypothetical protein
MKESKHLDKSTFVNHRDEVDDEDDGRTANHSFTRSMVATVAEGG